MDEKNLIKILAFDVVVPEIQREYVWGKNERVISQFIIDIRKKNSLNIGFVYSYKPYAKLNEIFLIDGQQRITTMVLIAFYCAIKDGKLKEFKKLMRLNKPKPAFSYRVRSCTKDFMLDLFNSIDNLNNLRKIEKQKWFLDRYKADMSISSMIKAIEIIDTNLNDINNLYDFIIKDVKFWYFNVGQTSQGEELYITMNSRGESLSDAEQIKPQLFERIKDPLKKQTYGKLWDNIEEYFYSLKPSDKGIEVVDLMMNRFIQLILQLENKTEKNIGGTSNALFSTTELQNIDLEKIKYYFDALKIINTNFKEKNEISLLACFYEETQKELYLYPLASLMKAVFIIVEKEKTQSKVILSEIQFRELLRLYHVIRNSVRRGTIKYVPLLKLLSNYNGEPIYKFILEFHLKLIEKDQYVLSPHELDKIRIIFNSESVFKTEEAFWESQESLSYLLGGSLKSLIEPFQNIEKWSNETLYNFSQRKELVSELFNPKIIKKQLDKSQIDGEIDNSLIARVMLTIGDYTFYTGGNNWCLGYDSYWKSIFTEKKGTDILSKLLTILLNYTESVPLYDRLQNILQAYIDEYKLENKDGRYYIVKYPESLQAAWEGNNILRFWNGWNNYRVEVLNKKRLSSYHVNPYATAVFNRLAETLKNNKINRCHPIDYSTGLLFDNGIHLIADSSHAWNVVYNEEIDAKTLPKGFEIGDLDFNVAKCYRYRVKLEDDLIEKGIELANQLILIQLVNL
jgi:uncharacterized protein with ParB-like and HNH nuclease domain